MANSRKELRKCIAKGREALFHEWSDGLAIVEYKDGKVDMCYFYEIQFTDQKD